MLPPASAAPKVPPNTISSAGMRMSDIGLPPSMIIATSSEISVMTMPRIVPGSMSALRLDRHDVERALRGRSGVDVLRPGDHRGAKVQYGLNDVFDRFGDQVLRPVHQRQHRVGGRVGALDEVRVEGERRAVEPCHDDHGFRPWRAMAVRWRSPTTD